MRVPKLQSATFSNTKKEVFVVYKSGKEATVRYDSLGIDKNIKEIWIDKETKDKTLGLRFEDGTADYMPSDQPLFMTSDKVLTGYPNSPDKSSIT